MAEVRLVRLVANAESNLTREGYQSSDPTHTQLHDDLFRSLRSNAVKLVTELCEGTKLNRPGVSGDFLA